MNGQVHNPLQPMTLGLEKASAEGSPLSNPVRHPEYGPAPSPDVILFRVAAPDEKPEFINTATAAGDEAQRQQIQQGKPAVVGRQSRERRVVLERGPAVGLNRFRDGIKSVWWARSRRGLIGWQRA